MTGEVTTALIDCLWGSQRDQSSLVLKLLHAESQRHPRQRSWCHERTGHGVCWLQSQGVPQSYPTNSWEKLFVEASKRVDRMIAKQDRGHGFHSQVTGEAYVGWPMSPFGQFCWQLSDLMQILRPTCDMWVGSLEACFLEFPRQHHEGHCQRGYV